MTLPGVVVQLQERPPALSFDIDTGTWFVVGTSDLGPSNEPLLIRNLSEFEAHYGTRQSYSSLFDAMETFFAEGGSRVYVGRVVGPAATKGLLSLNDRDATPDPTLRVDALGPGSYSTRIKIQITDGSVANTYIVIVLWDDVEVERSPDLATPTTGVAWALSSDYIRLVDLASATAAPANNPAVLAATALSAGADDRLNIVDAQWLTALNLFPKDLGPGQVSAPGRTTDVGHGQLRDHANTNGRVAVLDMPDTATVGTLTASVAAARHRVAGYFAPWVKIPGLSGTGTTRTVPPSALIAGLCARNDRRIGTASPSAGNNGIARYVVGVSQIAWNDADRSTLNVGGVNVIRVTKGIPKVYGWRSSVDPNGVDNRWISFGHSRQYAEIYHRLNEVGESFVFDNIDGPNGETMTEWRNSLIGEMMRYWDSRQLFSETDDPSDAFYVDTGPAVNTVVTMQNRELNAAISYRPVGMAERVIINVSKRQIDESVV